jgi:hypothetical protein
MTEFTYTLLGDGASDEVLLRHLAWLIEQTLNPRISTRSQWADLRACRTKPSGLASRIRTALTLYPCDLLFVHRDAESQRPQERYDEIMKAINQSGSWPPPVVCVVPVRMQEAWLLFDETAIRQAAGNPNGKVKLSLPSPVAVEAIPDPKAVLYERLRMASELTGRRLKKFSEGQAARRVAEYTSDFSPLRQLCAFRRLEDDLRQSLESHGWT